MEAPGDIRSWNLRPMRWDGGRLAVARARSEGWRYIDDPDASYAAGNWYHSKTIRLLSKAHATWAVLTWSEGFPDDFETRHRAQAADYIHKLQTVGIRAMASLPLSEIADLDSFTRNPEFQFWVARDEEGSVHPIAQDHAGRATRYRACLSQPGWRKHLCACATAAAEAKANAVLLEHLGGACRCELCREAFARFARERFGLTTAMTPGAGESPVPPGLLAAFYASQADEIVAEVGKACARAHASSVQVSRSFRIADGVLPGSSSGLLVCSDLMQPGIQMLEPDTDVLSDKEDEKTRHVTNAGLLTLLAADRLGRPVQVSSNMGAEAERAYTFPAMTAEEAMLALAETRAFGASYAPPVRGGLLTGLYFAERQALQTLMAMRKYYGFFRRHSSLYESTVSLAKTVVLVNHGFRSAEFLGWLARKGVIFDARFLEGLSARELETYDLVIVPDYDDIPPVLGDAAWSALDGFVAEGGVVLLSETLAQAPRVHGITASSPKGSSQVETIAFQDLRARDPDRLIAAIRSREDRPLIQVKAAPGVMVRPMVGLPRKGGEERFVLHIVNFRSRAVPELTIHVNLNRLPLKTIKALSPDAPMELRHSRFGGLLEVRCGPLLTYGVLSGSAAR
ncbi:MAG: hypothetical protein V2A58_10230 [Planctomycetota bacterium]